MSTNQMRVFTCSGSSTYFLSFIHLLRHDRIPVVSLAPGILTIELWLNNRLWLVDTEQYSSLIGWLLNNLGENLQIGTLTTLSEDDVNTFNIIFFSHSWYFICKMFNVILSSTMTWNNFIVVILIFSVFIFGLLSYVDHLIWFGADEVRKFCDNIVVAR